IGHKGARLTSQVSLPGRFLVYVPGGGMTGISRRLPDNERHRLKSILKKIVPEDAGVIVRTAAEGASEEDLTRDVERLQAQWATISKKAAKTSSAPTLVHGEPDLAIRVVRDVFNEDFKTLVVQGEQAWTTVSEYVEGVAPDLGERVSKHAGDGDLFHELRVDEQLLKALDRKVWLPSGGSLVIDRTEAMTVIDVNTGKFVGSGGNLEQTVTRNNLEAAEEIVRQLRLRDVGGIVVIDFIDMVLESNRDLVLRRLTECLGRDRTKHQVAEVTSLGLVQMTRKRVGEGLLEAFSEPCEVCHGRGILVHPEPVDKSGGGEQPADRDGSDGVKKPARRKRGKRSADDEAADPSVSTEQRTKALAAMNAIHRAAHPDDDGELVAGLELDAVNAVLAGSELDADRLAAEVMRSSAVANDAAESAQSAAHEQLAEAVDTAVLADPGADTDAAEPAEPIDVTDAIEAPAAAEEKVTPAPARAARPRRRRAASRPAGPPAAG
ncbi:MAG: Rne/Rng family ribonuclease, partial [Jatrophihabitantaceae bacterium]